MKPSQIFHKATKFKNQMDDQIKLIDAKLQKLYEDDYVHITYQPSDGWCICDSDSSNFAICLLDIDKVLQMPKEQALKAIYAAYV